ncbi:helix-turn-helix domain-containing protein [Myroides odoratus]
MKEEMKQNKEGILSSTEILTRLKILLGVRSAKELAHFFNLKPNTISSWKKRNTLSYSKIIELCSQHEIDLNELFYTAYQNIAINKSYVQVPIVYLDDYLEYYLNLHTKNKKIKQIYFPKSVNFNFVIQMYSNSLERMQGELVYVFCKKVELAQVSIGKEYVFLIKNKGFQKYTVLTYEAEQHRLRLDRQQEETIWLNMKEVSECFQCIHVIPC